MLNKATKRFFVVVKFSLLPVLAVLYPITFHYANNVNNLGIIPLSKLGNLSILMVGISMVVYVFFYIINQGRIETATISTLIFLLFFNTYGVFFDLFLKWNMFLVEHYSLLPLFILSAFYSSWFVVKIDIKRIIEFLNIITIILIFLILFNVVKIIPAEVTKVRAENKNIVVSVNKQEPTPYHDYPDIYFIIFDEYVGFEGARKYWHYDEIDDFVEFLKIRGFYVAERSHVVYPSTLNSISTSLNYQNYPLSEDKQIYYDALKNNKVMQFLKSLGYTTVLFNGENYAYSEEELIDADFSYKPPAGISSAGKDGPVNDEFELLVANNTMIRPFIKYFNKNLEDPLAERNKNMIFYSLDKISKLDEIPSPKFVYVHLMIPHSPFLFDARGNLLDSQNQKNWNYYLGNYIFATTIAKQMVTSILESSEPEHPPIIILQSDHGARNGKNGYADTLVNYPDEYKTLIMNALYLPGCDTQDLKQDMKPINTFPIIFNCYLGANIPIQ